MKIKMTDKGKVRAGSIAAVVVGIVAILLGILFEKQNVSFLVGLAFAVAASANLPAILMLLFWKRTTAKGITWAIVVGMLSALALILFSPTLYELYGLPPASAPFPLQNPGIVSIPLGFLTLIVVSLLTKKRKTELPWRKAIMKNKTTIVLLILLAFAFSLTAQEEKTEFGITFGGFIKSDFFYDSRQTVNIREGHFLLYPAAEFLADAGNQDINAAPSLNFLSIQTRLTGTITAPDAFGARVKGVLEADFFGNENAAFVDANGFRLRHAYAQLSWKKTQLLFGQYWHPLFIPACFAEVVSFNTGSPIQPFSRNPQVRIVQPWGNST